MKKSFLHLAQDLTYAIQNLQGSTFAYDRGYSSSSLSIAASIRTLFHQTSRSEALVKQFCDFENKEFYAFKMVSTKRLQSTAAKLILFDGSMCHMQMTIQSAQYLPNLNESPQREVSFREWWDEPVIRDVSNGFDNPIWHTRRDLIITHANKEGGTHFDPSLSELHGLGTNKAVGWQFRNTNNEVLESTPNQKTATIRQIAYEALHSLYHHYQKFFGELYF